MKLAMVNWNTPQSCKGFKTFQKGPYKKECIGFAKGHHFIGESLVTVTLLDVLSRLLLDLIEVCLTIF